MAWNMPQFLEIHIIKKILLVQLYGCTRSIFNITIEQHCVQNKCQAFFNSVRQLLPDPDADAGADD